MNRTFLVFGVMMVMFAGIFHIMFIMYDYGFNNPDSGAFTQLRERLNESMNGSWQTDAYNKSVQLQQFFGIGRVICIGLAPVMFVIAVAGRKNTYEE